MYRSELNRQLNLGYPPQLNFLNYELNFMSYDVFILCTKMEKKIVGHSANFLSMAQMRNL